MTARYDNDDDGDTEDDEDDEERETAGFDAYKLVPKSGPRGMQQEF